MNINKIQMSKANALNIRKNITASRPLFSNMADSVSFGSQDRSKTQKTASMVTALVMALANLSGSASAQTTKTDKAVEDFTNLGTAQIQALNEENEAQLAQIYDAPSITFDMTGNYQARVITPSVDFTTLSSNPFADNEYGNLNDVITSVYGIPESEIEERSLAAYAIAKANPWMVSFVTQGEVDYTQGDVANMDPQLILATDYTTAGNQTVFLPEITPMVETGRNRNTTFVASLEFMPKNADEQNVSYLSITPEELSGVKSDAELTKLINSKLAQTYGLKTMDCYAGDAIWHAVAIYEPNEEVFQNGSESEATQMAVDFANDNGYLEIACPRIPVSVIARNGQISASDVKYWLTRKNDKEWI